MAKKAESQLSITRSKIDKLLTVGEYAEIRGCCEKTIWRAIKAGNLPVIRTGRRVHIHPRYAHIDL